MEWLLLKSEIEAVLVNMNRNKAAGWDAIVIEMLSASEDFGIKIIKIFRTEIINKIYNNGEILEDLQSNTKEIKCKWTMNQLAKYVIMIIMNRDCCRIIPEIGQKYC